MVLIDSEGNEISMPLVKVPNNGKDNYAEKSGAISEVISEGLYTLRINVTGGICYIDNVKFVCTEPTGINEVTNDEVVGTSYNLFGMPVNAGYRGIVIKNGKKVVVK
jgi:hypothetical protein